MSIRAFLESPIEQGKDEAFAYDFDVSKWPGSTYSLPTVVVYDITNGACDDVTGSVTDGGATLTDSIFKTPAIVSLEAFHIYRVECQWHADGNSVFEAYLVINAKE